MKTEELLVDMTSLGARLSPGKPVLRRACVIRANLGFKLEFGTTQGTVRAVFPITGGEARIGSWNARIMPGGADFALRLPNGVYVIEARYCLELEDATLIMVTNAGVMRPQADGSYRGITRATLEVSDGPHRNLGDAVYFGTAIAEANDNEHVYIELWEAVV